MTMMTMFRTKKVLTKKKEKVRFELLEILSPKEWTKIWSFQSFLTTIYIYYNNKYKDF